MKEMLSLVLAAFVPVLVWVAVRFTVYCPSVVGSVEYITNSAVVSVELKLIPGVLEEKVAEKLTEPQF